MQPSKLHCCHTKSLNEAETPTFVIYLFFVSRAPIINLVCSVASGRLSFISSITIQCQKRLKLISLATVLKYNLSSAGSF